MLGALRIFYKDLFELLEGIRGIALVFVLPSLLLLLVGQLYSQFRPFRLLVAGTAFAHEEEAQQQFDQTLRLLREISALEVHTQEQAVRDPLRAMNRGGFDLLLNVGDVGTDYWGLYTAATNPSRLVSIQELATGLERARYLIQKQASNRSSQPAQPPPPPAPSVAPPPPALPSQSALPSDPEWMDTEADKSDDHQEVQDSRDEVAQHSESAGRDGTTRRGQQDAKQEVVQLTEQVFSVGAFPTPSLFIYYPQVTERSLRLLPATIAFILCFLPLVLAAPSLIREQEAHTLEALLVAPNIKPGFLFGGKCLLPLAVTLFDFLLMLVLAQSVYHMHVKSGLVYIIMFLVPALLSPTLLGLALSAMATSQSQAMISSAIYFLALTLLSGFLYPIGESAYVVQALSKLFPLTFVHPVLNAWMFGGYPTPYLTEALYWLSFQCVLYGVLAALAFRRTLHYV
jgi:ABC-type multidrug transport system permease subunit